MRLKWKLVSVRLEIVLILMQDRCTVCVECTIGSEINWDGPNETDEDILHYYPLAKTQQKKAKWPSCSRAAIV
jgi:hypothetical protein